MDLHHTAGRPLEGKSALVVEDNYLIGEASKQAMPVDGGGAVGDPMLARALLQRVLE